MAQLQITEVVLFNIIKSFLNYIRDDYFSNTDKTKTYLYRQLNGISVGDFNFYEEAKTIFTRRSDDQRLLDVRMSFDAERAPIPTIHLVLPSEMPGPVDGIGISQENSDIIWDDLEGKRIDQHKRSFQSQYNLIITSNNPWEVVCIYHVLRSLLISVLDSVNIANMQNPKLSGGDITTIDRTILAGVFMRVLSIDCFYEIVSPSIFVEDIIKKIIFDGTITQQVVIEAIEEDKVYLMNFSHDYLIDPIYGLTEGQKEFLGPYICTALSGIDNGNAETDYSDSFVSLDEGGA